MRGKGAAKLRECGTATLDTQGLPVALRAPQLGGGRDDLGAGRDMQGVVDGSRARIPDGQGAGMRR